MTINTETHEVNQQTTKNYSFLVTFFPDVFARTKTQQILDIDELIEILVRTHASEKSKLPFLKFASFGDVRTKNGCLRNDNNIKELSGVIGDYDEEQMPFEEAVERVRTEGICALLYTSPSNKPGRPRWRIIAPFSQLLKTEHHELNLNKLNGIVGGVLAPESWALSQSYYYGYTPESDANYKIEWIPGDFIDQRSDLPSLEKTALSKTKTNEEDQLKSVSKKWRELIISGDASDYNNDESRLVAAATRILANNIFSDDEIQSILLDSKYGISRHCLAQADPERAAARAIEFVRRIPPELEKLNKEYAFILLGGRSGILREIINEHGRPDFTVITLEAFNTYNANRKIRIGDRLIPATKYWLEDPQRRTYDGLIFAPGRQVPEYYNTWQGFTVNPDQNGNCSKFLAHIKDNICSGDDQLYNYVIMWFAHIFQNPGEKVGTSLVLRGKQGVGKSKVAEIIGHLLGAHFSVANSGRYITGQFNSHLTRCLLLFADEAFWGGDKKSEGMLKDLVTGTKHLIEYKGKEAVEVDNYVRLLVSSNLDWVVPAGLEERRFCVIDVSDAQMQNISYFAAIDEEMENGGYGALIHFFLNVDVDKVALRKIPETEALLDQKIEGMPSNQAWWLDLLFTGLLPAIDPEEPNVCPVESLYESYIQHAQNIGFRKRNISTALGIYLGKMMPPGYKLVKIRRLFYIGDQQVRKMCYVFPPLRLCRQFYESQIQQRLGWDELEEWMAYNQLNRANADVKQEYGPTDNLPF